VQERDVVLRRSLLKLGGSFLAGAGLEAAVTGEPDAMNAVLETSTVSEHRLAALEDAATALGVAAVRGRPREVVTAAVADFRTVRRLVQDRQRTSQRVRLIRAGSRLATVVGEILFNEGRFDAARDWYLTAYQAALDVGDRALADYALAGQAYLATYSDDPPGVLGCVQARLGGSHRPSPGIAWLWGFTAKAHATLGERGPADRALEHARNALDASPDQDVHPGIFSFVPEKLAFYEAAAHVVLGNGPAALDAADRALARYDMTETTEPALVRFERASALVHLGQTEEACRYATGTVLDPRTYPSITVRARAARFDTLLGAPGRSPAVDQWRDILHDTYHHPPAARAHTAHPPHSPAPQTPAPRVAAPGARGSRRVLGA
jgi:tetratricopeptide (TPR) repeat protein